MKIGNIIYLDELVNHKKVEFINYYENIDDFSIVDYTLPTLFVGWKYLKSLNQINNNLSILDKNIVANKIYWEFSFNENKSEHINGVEYFTNNLPNYYFKDRYTYVDLNPLFFNISEIEELFLVLPKKIEKSYLIENKMLYLLVNNKITGIDLETYNFFNFNVKTILNQIELISENHVIDEDSAKLIKQKEIFIGFGNLKRYMVTII